MSVDYQKLRLFGVYQQDKEENLMLRVKIPAGLLTSAQALEIAAISTECSNGVLHLSCRGSMEFHWLKHPQLEDIFSRLNQVGLTTRGACGGAVRGIACSTSFSAQYLLVQRLAQKLNDHFAGNAEFEGLPKKFKVSVDAGYQGSRHLIQDVGLVLVSADGEPPCYDVWCGGGLGRLPQAGFLLQRAVPQTQLIHLIESVTQVYRENTPPPKRVKFLLNQVGEEKFRSLLQQEMAQRPVVELPQDADSEALESLVFHEIPVFAGELPAERLVALAKFAAAHDGQLATTADQNIALVAATPTTLETMRQEFQDQQSEGANFHPRFRVCPGNHECRMGLAPTRDIARKIDAHISESAQNKSWAISGCSNSCSQPQLANYGIVTSKLPRDENGERQPLFDLYRRDGDGLGQRIEKELSAERLYEIIRTLK
ncbi:MAG: nitrite/sulfite reductase [Desulfuromonadales bacterium]|nr:nitrite/sulfite reductase [Desulfuromonadales bacterium]